MLPLRVLLDDMVVDAVVQRDDRVDGERPLHRVGVVLVQAELAVASDVVRVVRGGLVVLVLHEVEVPGIKVVKVFHEV